MMLGNLSYDVRLASQRTRDSRSGRWNFKYSVLSWMCVYVYASWNTKDVEGNCEIQLNTEGICVLISFLLIESLT